MGDDPVSIGSLRDTSWSTKSAAAVRVSDPRNGLGLNCAVSADAHLKRKEKMPKKHIKPRVPFQPGFALLK
jgi:hypothetical protein